MRALMVAWVAVLCLLPPAAWGEAPGSAETLDMYSAWPDPELNVSRIPRPASRVAENVTVITAADIERLNAHTLAEVLQTVPGIQLDFLRTPNTIAFFNLQGALNTTVLMLVDGIRQNGFDQGMAMPGLIPVQQIERIEIVKGAASAAWGSALGGVINIITKTPAGDRQAEGMLSGSVGSRFTADSRAELNGTLDRLGYYLTIGNLHSDGLDPNTRINLNNLYGKFSYQLPSHGTATVGVWHLNSRQGVDEGEITGFGFVHDDAEFVRTNAFLKFSQPLGSQLQLDLDGYVTNRADHAKLGGVDGQGAIAFTNDFTTYDSTRGGSARLSWGDNQAKLVAGVEYGHVNALGKDLFSTAPPFYGQSWDHWALHLNGAYSIGRLTLLPGIRHDITGLAGNNTSYTLGATYQLAENTTLRSYAARGFSLPNVINNRDTLQKIDTLQAGFETGEIPYLWLKGTYFINSLHNSESAGSVPTVTDQNRQGFEVELRTAPLLGVSLQSGYTYLYAVDSTSGVRLETNPSQSVPPHTVKLALNYDNASRGMQATLTGNYVWWHSSPAYPTSDRGMIWNLHLNWKPFLSKRSWPELFFSCHNLFNGNQTTFTELYSTTPRWFEGGLRVRF